MADAPHGDGRAAVNNAVAERTAKVAVWGQRRSNINGKTLTHVAAQNEVRIATGSGGEMQRAQVGTEGITISAHAGAVWLPIGRGKVAGKGRRAAGLAADNRNPATAIARI